MKTIEQDPRDDEGRRTKPFWKRVHFWAILLLLAAASAFYKDSLREIWQGIRQISYRELACCVLLSLAAYCLEGLTIDCMVGAVMPGVPAREGVGIAFLCEFCRMITLGNGSGLAEIYYLHQNGIGTGTATVLTMLQYVCKRTAVMLLGAAGYLALSFDGNMRVFCREYAGFMAAGILIGLGIIALFLGVVLSARVTRILCTVMDLAAAKVPSGGEKLKGWKGQAKLLNRAGRGFLGQKKRIAGVIILQAGKLLLFYGITAYLFRGNELLQAADCFFLMAVVYMLSGIIPAPSGAGSLEFVFLLFFSRFAAAKSAVPVILVFRFSTWIVPFLIGGGVNIMRRVQPDL